MRQKLLKKFLVLTMLGIVFAGFVMLNRPILFRAYRLLGWSKLSDKEGFFVIDCTNLSKEAIAKKSNSANRQNVKLIGATVDERFFLGLRELELRAIKFEDYNYLDAHGKRDYDRGILALRQANPSWKIKLPGRKPVNNTTDLTHVLNLIPSVDEISKVEGLTFSGMLIPDLAMSIVKDASNLKHLSLTNYSVTDDDLQSLQGLENLERLHLSSVNVNGPGLQFVPVNVKELWLYSEMDVAWNHLDRLVQLENLEIVETHVSEDDLRAIQGLKHLKTLTVTSKNSQWDGLQHLPTSINNLGVFYGVTNDAVRQLGRLNSLSTLAVGGKLISDEACNDLANMKSLRFLELHKTAITEAG